jgi:deoxyribonuclease-4
MAEKLLIGSHVSMNAPKYYLGSVEEALSYGSTTFMFYTGAPQNSYRKPLDELKIAEGRDLIKKAGIDEATIIVHAPYIINGANKGNPNLYNMSKDIIINELRRTAGFGAKILVLHPGAHVGQGNETGIRALAETLNRVFKEDGTDVKIALETMSGKGSEIGITFQEIRKIIDLCEYKDRLGVCFDTCHTHDYGYNIKDVDQVLKDFDEIVGLDRLLVIHVNDSKNPQGAHKDRHENLGYGYIGFDTINKIVHHPLLVNIPKILETPYIDEKPPYKKEIGMLKNGVFEENWRDYYLNKINLFD